AHGAQQGPLGRRRDPAHQRQRTAWRAAVAGAGARRAADRHHRRRAGVRPPRAGRDDPGRHRGPRLPGGARRDDSGGGRLHHRQLAGRPHPAAGRPAPEDHRMTLINPTRPSEPEPAATRSPVRLTRERLGLLLFAVVLLATLLSPVLVPYDPLEPDYGARYAPISGEHLLGTDGLGRDVLSRALAGGRVSLVIALSATALTMLLGGSLGALAASLGGAVDTVLSRLFDALLAFPGFLLILLA